MTLCLCGGGGRYILFLFQGFGAGRMVERERSIEEKRKTENMRREMDAQVLLLMDPGAELGWTVLSDTLPSCEAGDVCARA